MKLLEVSGNEADKLPSLQCFAQVSVVLIFVLFKSNATKVPCHACKLKGSCCMPHCTDATLVASSCMLPLPKTTARNDETVDHQLVSRMELVDSFLQQNVCVCWPGEHEIFFRLFRFSNRISSSPCRMQRESYWQSPSCPANHPHVVDFGAHTLERIRTYQN